MPASIGIITPAFRAERWIGRAVQSLIGQSYPHWRQWIISDDGVDYEAVLAAEGIRDSRLVFAATGGVGTGSSHARNVALDLIDTDHAALLDADDRFTPDKLEKVVAKLETHGIVSTAIAEFDEVGTPLRQVGAGPDLALPAGRYKFTCLSMDSMIAWDRRKTDGRCDESLGAMTDLALLLALFERVEAAGHIGTPLHHYIKMGSSISNGAGVTARMVHAKTELLRRLETGHYRLADPAGNAGMAKFLRLSLAAEQTFGAALAARPGLLFEDHLEPLLRAAT